MQDFWGIRKTSRKWASLSLLVVAAWGGLCAAEVRAADVRLALPRSMTLKREGSDKIYTVKLTSGSGTDIAAPDVVQCLNSAFEMPGQAWHVDLSTGGLMNRASSLLPKEIVDAPTRIRQLLPNSVVYSSDSSLKTTVLVIDDFQVSEVRLDEDGAGSAPMLALKVRHGALVVAHLEMALRGAGFTKVLSDPNKFMKDGDTFTKNGTNRTIRVKPFDYGALGKKYKNGPKVVTANDLTDALIAKYDPDPDVSPMIINMSFSLIPCNIMQRYIELKNEADKFKNPPLRLKFNDFLLEIQKLSTDMKLWKGGESIESVLTATDQDNSLSNWFTKQKNSRSALLVASSGNYHFPFETMPAAWAGVLGVGAVSVVVPDTVDWSDASDVSEVGQWFVWPKSLPNDFCLVGATVRCVAPTGSPLSAGQFAYRGTSFSAPTVSATLAVAYGTSTCPLSLSHSWPFAKLQPLSFADFMTKYCH